MRIALEPSSTSKLVVTDILDFKFKWDRQQFFLKNYTGWECTDGFAKKEDQGTVLWRKGS